MDEKIQSSKENNTFTPPILPKDKKTVGGKWVYSVKNDIEGNVKYKARFVVQGYSQKMGVDYGETFSPTANLRVCEGKKQHRRTCYSPRWM